MLSLFTARSSTSILHPTKRCSSNADFKRTNVDLDALATAYLNQSVTLTFDLQHLARSSVGKVKGKGFPCSLPSVGPTADHSVQAVSPQVTSHPPGGRLPLLSARPAVTFPAAEHHRPLTGTKLYCLVTEAHRCEQLAWG